MNLESLKRLMDAALQKIESLGRSHPGQYDDLYLRGLAAKTVGARDH
jgi:hypothetical protein